MCPIKDKLSDRKWKRDNYFISTDPKLIPISDLNAVFATDLVYWADPLPEEVMRETIENSLNFGLYELQDPDSEVKDHELPAGTKLVGFSRCVTDFTTFLYLTDVFVDSSCQGKGLGAWMIRCVQEVIKEMPYLRRSLLFTGDWERSVPFYEKLMEMRVMEFKRGADGKSGKGLAVMQMPGPGFPDSLRKYGDVEA